MNDIMKNVAIVELPGANIKSVDYWVKRNGANSVVVRNDTEDAECDVVVLPGVGHFDRCMSYIRKSGVDKFIARKHADGVVVLGICLGMQIMFESSEEGEQRGLGLLPGRIERLEKGGMSIPNIGWRNITKADSASDINKVFFMHGYALKERYSRFFDAENARYWLSECNNKFIAGFRCNNLVGFQFHPEKSYLTGDRLLLEVFDEQKSYC